MMTLYRLAVVEPARGMYRDRDNLVALEWFQRRENMPVMVNPGAAELMKVNYRPPPRASSEGQGEDDHDDADQNHGEKNPAVVPVRCC